VAIVVQLSQGSADLVHYAAMDRQRHVPDRTHQDVAGAEVGVLDQGCRPGEHKLVEVAPDGDESGSAAGGRCGQLGDDIASWTQLAEQPVRYHPRPRRAAMRSAQGHQRVNAVVAA